MNGRVNYKQYFKKPDSQYTVDDSQSFNRPYNFDMRMNNIKQRFDIET